MGAHLTRRNLLRAGLGVAAGASLAACGDGGPAVPLADDAQVRLPDYVPYKSVKADFPGTEAGVLNGYLHYPDPPVRAFPDGPPAKGPGINFMTLIFNPVPPPVSRNTLWRELNSSLGTDLDFEIVPVADYPTKFSLTIAGGDLPDGMLFLPTAPQRPATLNALFEDLSPHLSGSAVRDYPYLANIPTKSWRDTICAGGIYGLPMPRLNTGSVMFYRADIFKEKSLDPNPASFQEFKKLCVELSDPRRSKYACGDPLTTFYFVMEMLHAPKDWRETGGRFTWWLEESERVKQGLDAMRQLVRARVIHPDGFTVKGKYKDWFGNGQIAINYDGATAWNDNLRAYGAGNPKFDIDGMIAPGFDGGQGVHWAGDSAYGMLALKKAPRERIEQLLRALNALAAPFGTDGYLLRKYGVAGHDFGFKGTDPILNTVGTTENTLPTMFATDAPQVLYFPEDPSVVPRQHAFQERAVDILVSNPAEGLYSETDSTLGGTAKNLILEGTLKGVMQGRTTLKEWDAAIRDWRRSVGDKTRGEFETYWESLHR
ncbi:substrate-binding domain-containing protein [Streptomyces sp. NPDC088725]|uniref:substrate-binding domain-containing protein n=1 Tax=Streptomyces sp. NPDC088725 TaxID=3365873 RepID=UPI0037F682C4